MLGCFAKMKDSLQANNESKTSSSNKVTRLKETNFSNAVSAGNNQLQEESCIQEVLPDFSFDNVDFLYCTGEF